MFGFRAAISIVNRMGVKNGLRLSLVWSVLSLFALVGAYTRGADTNFLIGVSAILHGAGAWLYYNLFQVQLYSAVNKGTTIGATTAKIRIINMAGELSAAFLVTLLAATGHITASLVLAAASLLISSFFLYGFDDKLTAQMPTEAPRTTQVLTALSWPTILANWGLHGMFFGMISTVFLVSTAGVVDSLLLVSTLTLLKSVLSFVVGHDVDRKQSAHTMIGCGLFSILGPVATFLAASNPILLTCLRGCFDISESGIAVGLESRITKEVNDGCPWVNTACLEVARSQPDAIGYFIGYLLLSTTPDAPVIMLALGVPFAVIRVIYSMGGFKTKTRTVAVEPATVPAFAQLAPATVPIES
jgi:hypothetical protein